MKFLAILQIVCLLFLSSYPGTTRATTHKIQSDCCGKSAKTVCKNDHKKNKDTKGCSMLLTCGICGFLPAIPVAIKPVHFITIDPSVAIYKISNLSGYVASDWKPPRV